MQPLCRFTERDTVKIINGIWKDHIGNIVNIHQNCYSYENQAYSVYIIGSGITTTFWEFELEFEYSM